MSISGAVKDNFLIYLFFELFLCVINILLYFCRNKLNTKKHYGIIEENLSFVCPAHCSDIR